MTVNPQRDSCVAVSQLSLGHCRRCTDFEQQTRVRVPKRVEPAVRDAEFLQNWPQSLLHYFVRVERASEPVRE